MTELRGNFVYVASIALTALCLWLGKDYLPASDFVGFLIAISIWVFWTWTLSKLIGADDDEPPSPDDYTMLGGM